MTDWIQHPTAVPFSQDAMNDPYGTDAKALSAGRDLDARVAEKVMGWHWRRSESTGRRCLFNETWPEWFTQRADGTEPFVGDGPYHFVPCYSTDIGAAWTILSTIRATWLFSKRQRFFAALRNELRLTDGTVLAWPDAIMTFQETFPERLCRAALAATAP